MNLFIFQLLLLFYLFPQSRQECTILDKPFNCDDIILILDYHNEMRSKVAQGKTKLEEAMDMWALKWDDSLAIMAQDWANKCSLKPNTGRPNDVGENLAWHPVSDVGPIDVEGIIEMWFDEISKFDPEVKKVQDGTEHFTQMIWGDTKFVGCGSTIFKESGSESLQALVVCNYKPAGNFIDQPPYTDLDRTKVDEETGETIKCHRGVLSSRYPGLCGHDVGHSLGTYVPCVGYGENVKPTTWLWIVLLLNGFYQYIF